MKTVTTILLLTIFVSCNQHDKTKQVISIFTKPVISQPVTKDSIKYIEADFVGGFFPSFVGKYNFTDNLFIADKRDRDTIYIKGFMDERLVWRSDSLATDGFELVPDYPSNVYCNDYESKYANYYYPVYLINQTPTIKAFIGKDSYIFGLQEALDTDGQWRPIEGRGFDFCSNGYWGLKVHPQEFVTVLFPKYSGDYKTKIRVRIKNGDNIYVSKPYEGTINEQQLYLKEDGYFYRELIKNKASAIEYLFYGAKPFGTDDKDFGLHAVWTE
ncbi:MAG: hypothetical protein H6567_07495 [Lewinellaceae bacterium]|nr:hypothetical protein [Lewinellaceae bacterium]